MATVSNINGQFKFVNTNKSEFYQYPKLSHLTYVLNNEGQYYIQFTYEDDYFVRIKLSEITNQPTWTNTQPGAEQAVADISSWIYATASGLATEATLLDVETAVQQVETNTTSVARTPNFLRPSGSLGTVTAGTFSMSFASVGTGNATVGGMILKPGETINFDAGALNNTLGAVAYSTTTAGAELIIITLT
jgi:hypothetical protein